MDFDSADHDRGHAESGRSEVRGMESVVATVSGYHGTERFRLIKLISQTGASYVGTLARPTTHLVCWELKGKKFDLAVTFGTKIVGHRWFEDCLKHGRRISEDPYIMQCGEELGPLLWKGKDVLTNDRESRRLINKNRSLLNNISNSFCDSDALEVGSCSFDVMHSDLFDSQSSKNVSTSSITKKKGSKNGRHKMLLEHGHLMGHNRSQDQPILTSKESSSLYDMTSNRNKRLPYDGSGISAEAEPVCKGRRFVQSNAHYDSLNCIIVDNETASCSRQCYNMSGNNSLESSRDYPSNGTSHPPSPSHVPNSENLNGGINQLRNIGESENACISIHSRDLSSSEISKFEKTDQNGNDIGVHPNSEIKESDDFNEQNHLTELSCVICFTTFSSTRGVLLCGHRFCYLCIEGWANHMASKRKIPTCPLCKANFSSIKKVEGAAYFDQKIYSQTIPCSLRSLDENLCQDESRSGEILLPEATCCECQNHEPEDLLLCCHICSSQWVHSYCLDPPIIPWTCVHCRDLRTLYQQFR